ncbi:alpha/beta hydrolase [Streptomyces sp. NPDC052225]|uniref:RBBP9/YdeN family alpha/beta hydrolase n=1 Tax=Streptomyces sp. NPDC052225 TaxID=3154949 RepID=UPI0034165C58
MSDSTGGRDRQSFLLVHGWQNRRPEGHWQRWLAGELSARHDVAYPQFPEPDLPELDVWVRELERWLASDAPRVVVCHSLGCLLWLHAVARGVVGPGVERVLLVAPPSASFVASHPEIAGFAPPPLAVGQVTGARIVAGDDDPCCPEGALAAYGRPLGIGTDVVGGAGHLSIDDGYGAWPSVLAWCTAPDPAVASAVSFA